MLREIVNRTSEPAVTEMLATDVLLDVFGSCAVFPGAPGCTPILAVALTVLTEPSEIFPGILPTTTVAPDAIGPATSHVMVPTLMEQPAGSEPDCVNPVGMGICTRNAVAASGPALLTDNT